MAQIMILQNEIKINESKTSKFINIPCDEAKKYFNSNINKEI